MNRLQVLVTILNNGVAGPQYETPSYDNAFGKGDRPGLTGKITTSGGLLWVVVNPIIGALYDGVLDNNGGYLGDGIAVANAFLKVDFTDLHKVTEMKLYFSAACVDSGVWRPVGWDGETIEAVGPNFTLGVTGVSGLTQTIDASTHSKGYTAYGIQGVSGNSSFNLYYWSEIEFKIGALL